jgi:hypothetical protein
MKTFCTFLFVLLIATKAFAQDTVGVEGNAGITDVGATDPGL